MIDDIEDYSRQLQFLRTDSHGKHLGGKPTLKIDVLQNPLHVLVTKGSNLDLLSICILPRK